MDRVVTRQPLVPVVLAAFIAMVTGCNLRPESSASQTIGDKELAHDHARLELSEQCATAADRFWKRSGYEELRERSKGNQFVGPVLSYTSHFNLEMHRCLVMVRDRGLKPVRDDLYNEANTVLDASEGVLIAELSQTFASDDAPPKISLRWGPVVPLAIQQRHWSIARDGIEISKGEWESLNHLMEQ